MRGRCSWPVTAPLIGVLAAGLLAGCGTSTGHPSGHVTTASRPAKAAATAVHCGRADTAAGVPVVIEVEHGHVACETALTVEKEYAHALASGKVPGNGGGAPVTIRGWICQGFDTPTVLATGNTSACRKGGSELLAVLPSPTHTPTPS